jgi:hypothetical protein
VPNRKPSTTRGTKHKLKTWTKVAAFIVTVTIPALRLGSVLVPPADVGVEPTSAQMLFLIFVSVTEAVLLGLGVSFLIFGLAVIRRVSPDSKVKQRPSVARTSFAGSVRLTKHFAVMLAPG